MKGMEDLIICFEQDCLNQVKEDGAIYSSETVRGVDEGVRCGICGMELQGSGLSLLVHREDEANNNTLYCCDAHCSNEHIKNEEWTTAEMTIVQKAGSCGVCGKELPKHCFELVISNPE